MGITTKRGQKPAKARRGFEWALCLGVAAVASIANGTVVQVDGTIIPVLDGGGNCTGDLQECLDAEEGVSPPNANAIDAIVDAATVPEVFKPKLGDVVFLDVEEGAGYENSFGYYNVGDDVTDTSNLHPILGCGVPASEHPGEAAGYVQDAEGGDSTTINFQTEASAGRYKGGFIGFYLMTPEQASGGSGGSPNCGDFEDVGATSYFGRFYFTERDLNNDGDFVHHLVYNSRLTSDRFYFGFEDLFRGGDNDFEDMLIQVTGLTPPCSPRAEVCDGIDNDCDGEIDGELATIETGQSCLCDNGATCEAGIAQQGACLPGTTVCVAASVLCRQDAAPTTEACNSIDDNCDGTVDNGVPGTGVPCDGDDSDDCEEGTDECIGGVIVCTDDDTEDDVETCNNVDDDCDGSTDNNLTDIDVACDGSDSDLCPEGVTFCNGGVLECDDNSGHDFEVCNNFDDDCNGTDDDNLTDTGTACTVGVGVCTRGGATICTAGSLGCNVSPGSPGTEACDGADNDCDSVVDEGFNIGGLCDPPGLCGPGVLECLGGSAICSSAPGGSADESVPEEDLPETCNGVDDDCDGRIDEGFVSNACNDGSLCTDGATACLNGSIECTGGTPKLPEICNNFDDDCDDTPDNNLTDEGTPCGSDQGVCESGAEQCVGGTLTCMGAIGGDPDEICDGLDNDCNGTIDEEPTDVGVDCGLTDPPQGECAYGSTICVTGGIIQCAGAIQPTSETCNGLDDDCNGDVDDDPIDVGTICGSAMGTCEPGMFVCMDGERVCMGATSGVPEICNGIDDDCNNIIDDDPTDIGTACGSDVGICERGNEACIAGKLQCTGGVLPGTEICNGLDDDCNGDIDDGDLCEGGVCVDGRCSLPCDPRLEFSPCPTGERCDDDSYCVPDDCFEVTCETNDDGEATVCERGECVSACSVSDCPEPSVCRPSDGACVGNNCSFLPHLCEDDELCIDSMCVQDKCADVSCSAGEFCRDGDCVGSCANVTCGPTTLCVDGTCEETGCKASCGSGQLCDPDAGECIDNPCTTRGPCATGHVCDPQDGDCIADPCDLVTCPDDEDRPQVCYLGQCLAGDDPLLPSDADPPTTSTAPDGGLLPGGGIGTTGNPPDPSEEGDYVNATGGAACTAAGAGDAGSSSPLGLLIAGVTLALRRRRLTIARTALALTAALVFLSACTVEPFCVRDCPGDPDSTTGLPGGSVIPGGNVDAGGGLIEGGVVPGCVRTLPEDDKCNGIDDDCDGRVDEEFDLMRDLQHCGECGAVCQLPGSQSMCDEGQCIALGCFNGFVDLNDDADGIVNGDSDGCEYDCFETNDSEETCDEIDNDCDGATDEQTDLQADDDNCGVCGRFCEFFEATGECQKGKCEFDPMMDCNAGFIDQNGIQSDGCEFECKESNDGSEICDGLDNDCDGMTDESFDLPNNIEHCGKCDRVCEFQHATPHCNSGTCEFDPNTDCEAGFSDRDGIQLNGCEFECTVTNGGMEICDGLDNDCNGTVDGMTMDSGGTCNVAPGGTAEGACTETGMVACINQLLVCLGAPKATPEICDDLDNNCNGSVDESPVDAGRVCQQPEGICSAGLTECQPDGTLTCVRAVGPLADELCNDLDDDCDGTIDEASLTVGDTCGTDTGACTAGLIECNGGALECSSATAFGSPEVCNNADDDCDGVVDDAPTDEGGPCGENRGVCVQGSEVCMSGGLVCVGGVSAGTETCNGLDDDCDGDTDENLTRNCYDGESGTEGNPPCTGGTQTCAAGAWGPCAGQVVPIGETCDGADNDCDGPTDEALTQACYTGDSDLLGKGICRGGTQTCAGGTFSGSCAGEVLATAEDCDGLDNDCDEKIDEDDLGNDTPRTVSCYTGTPGTESISPCQAGLRTCGSGTLGACIGQVVDTPHVCGDSVDNDCDGDDDAAEGCLSPGAETRIDGGSAGADHSFDVRIAVGGNPIGRNVYAVWSDRRNGTPDVYLAISTNGGGTFSSASNLTGSVSEAAVKPEIVVARDGSDDRVYIGYQRVNSSDERLLYVLRSSNSGSSFSSETIANDSSTDNFKHHLATSSDGGDVVIVWERLDTTNLDRDVYASSSSNNGNSWTTDRRISVNSGSAPIAGKPKVVMLDSLLRVFVWREARAPRSSFDVFATYADHSDLSSGSPSGTRESQLEADVDDDRQSDSISVAAAGDQVYVVWNDLATLTSGEADVMFSRSTDGGGSFSVGQVLDDPVVELSRSYAPTLAVDPRSGSSSDDRVFVAWPDTRQGTQVYFTASTDSGGSFSTPIRASQDNSGPIPDVASAAGLAFAGGDELVLSYAAEDASEVMHIYAATSVNAGVTWGHDDFLLDGGSVDAVEPVIAPASTSSDELSAVILWSDFRSGSNINGDIYRSVVAP